MKLIEYLRVFLGQRYAGLVLTLVVFFVGAFCLLFSPTLAYVVMSLGLVMLIGVFVAGSQHMRLSPPMGKLYRVDDAHVHLLAEGDSGDNHPVIWVTGGHGEGLGMYHLHKLIRDESRSILFDRTGSGWSDPARRPVTISGEVEKLKKLLEAAGEKGPFVLAGHSFGGLFSANFAHHYPELVAGVMLLDSTPPWNVAFAGRLSFSAVLRKAWWGALASHFGLQRLVETEIDDPESAHARELSDVANVVNANSVQPKSLLAEASVFNSVMNNPLDLVIGKGDLGDIPLLLMSANPTDDQQQELRVELQTMLGLTELQIDNLIHGLRDSMDQQVALSTRGRHVLMPIGSTHMFPYEDPDLVIDEVRKMIQPSNTEANEA